MKRDDFTQKVSRTVERFGMDVSRPLTLVSGGPDSVALLRVLLELGSGVRVLHLDHGLRGGESRGDAGFVRDLCKDLGLPLEVRSLDLDPGGNLQERARDERYRVAAEVASTDGCSSLAVGHNADDVAETVLMNLARGAGLRGMSGIPPVSGAVVRPLIERPRAEILAYLASLDQPFRTDSTNLTGKYTRNRFRLGVMPLLEELYPGAARNLGRTATLAARDLATLEGLASEAVEDRDREVVVRRAELPHPGLLSHALRAAYSRLVPQGRPFDRGRVEDISRLLRKDAGTRTLDLPGGVTVAVRNGEEVAFYPKNAGGDESSGGEVVSLSPGDFEFGGWEVRVEEVDSFDRVDAARRGVVYLDAGGGPYRVRLAREGDTIRPLGLGGTKKVFRAMMDRRVPRDLRSKTPVVVDREGAVAWVFGGESDERGKVAQTTRKILRVEARKV